MAASIGLPPALAQDANPTIGVALSISDPSDCVQPEGVYAAVKRRSSRVQFLPQGAHAVEVHVNPEQTATGTNVWHANVELTRASAREPARRLETTDCPSLVDAIGFIIALTFDPPGAAKPEPEPLPPPLTAPPPERRSRTVELVSNHSPEPDQSPNAFEMYLAGAFEVVSEAGPLLLPGFGLGVHVASSPETGLSPSFAAHLQISAFPGRTVSETGGEARFRLLAARLSLCPVAFHEGVFTLRPCASGTWGALNAKGSGTLAPEEHTRPWASLGGGLWAGVNATSNLRLELEAGLGAALVRDAFQFEPNIFYRTSGLSARAGLGLSLLLP
jgi:hypothetical protein